MYPAAYGQIAEILMFLALGDAIITYAICPLQGAMTAR